MDLTLVAVLDSAVKIGLGALITAISGYLVLVKTQSYEESKDAKNRFYIFQEEKKSKYVEFLAQSQELIQSHLLKSALPSAEEYKSYRKKGTDLFLSLSRPEYPGRLKRSGTAAESCPPYCKSRWEKRTDLFNWGVFLF